VNNTGSRLRVLPMTAVHTVVTPAESRTAKAQGEEDDDEASNACHTARPAGGASDQTLPPELTRVMPTLASLVESKQPVAVWHDLESAGYLVSDLGMIDGTPVSEIHCGHCPGRDHCVSVREPLRRCLLFSSALLPNLDEESGLFLDFHARRRGELITIGVDHVGADGNSASWIYRLLPMRWRNTDPPGYVDTGLKLGVWPD
jgi:hypothetical protein